MGVVEIVPATGHSLSGAKFARDDIAASQTDDVVVAAVAGRKIRVHAVFLMCGATATTTRFRSKPGGAGTDISCLFQPGANGGAVLPFNEVGWFETVIGEGLAASTGAGSATGYQIVYTEV